MPDRQPLEAGTVSTSLLAPGRAREGYPLAPVVAGQYVTPILKQRSRELRHDLTPAERILWGRLRAHRLENTQFRRQQVIAGCIVDFYCTSARLVVEIDGTLHQGQVDQDRDRDAVLEAHGVRVIRFTNDEVICELPAVIARIGAELTPPSPSPARGGRKSASQSLPRPAESSSSSLPASGRAREG